MTTAAQKNVAPPSALRLILTLAVAGLDRRPALAMGLAPRNDLEAVDSESAVLQGAFTVHQDPLRMLLQCRGTHRFEHTSLKVDI